jgi:hypothetical protein
VSRDEDSISVDSSLDDSEAEDRYLAHCATGTAPSMSTRPASINNTSNRSLLLGRNGTLRSQTRLIKDNPRMIKRDDMQKRNNFFYQTLNDSNVIYRPATPG